MIHEPLGIQNTIYLRSFVQAVVTEELTWLQPHSLKARELYSLYNLHTHKMSYLCQLGYFPVLNSVLLINWHLLCKLPLSTSSLIWLSSKEDDLFYSKMYFPNYFWTNSTVLMLKGLINLSPLSETLAPTIVHVYFNPLRLSCTEFLFNFSSTIHY